MRGAGRTDLHSTPPTSATAMPNRMISGPCSLVMMPLPLGMAMPLAIANPARAPNSPSASLPQTPQERAARRRKAGAAGSKLARPCALLHAVISIHYPKHSLPPAPAYPYPCPRVIHPCMLRPAASLPAAGRTDDGEHGVDASGRHLNGRDGLLLAVATPLQLQHACAPVRSLPETGTVPEPHVPLHSTGSPAQARAHSPHIQPLPVLAARSGITAVSPGPTDAPVTRMPAACQRSAAARYRDNPQDIAAPAARPPRERAGWAGGAARP